MSKVTEQAYNFMTAYEARAYFPTEFDRGQAHCVANRIISGDYFLVKGRVQFPDIPSTPGNGNAYTRGWNEGHDADVSAPEKVWEQLTEDDRSLLTELGHAEKFI